MKNTLLLLTLSTLLWFSVECKGYAQDQYSDDEEYYYEDEETSSEIDFSCDGRQYCTQMTSCAEAIYFIRHCPNTKMDGDNDGVPCERQWCH